MPHLRSTVFMSAYLEGAIQQHSANVKAFLLLYIILEIMTEVKPTALKFP